MTNKQLSVLPLLATARPVVLGVLTARRNDNIRDAHLLMTGYFKDADKAGYRNTQAWSQLFAAAVLTVSDLVDAHAASSGEQVSDVIAQMAIALAISDES